MLDGIHSYTNGGRMRLASYAEVAMWVKTAWDDISESTVKNSFIKCEIISETVTEENDVEEDYDNCSVLSDSILNLFNSETDGSDFE